MSAPQTPSAGALKAAESIIRGTTGFDVTARVVTPVALIIDRDAVKPAVAELVAGLREMAANCRYCHGARMVGFTSGSPKPCHVCARAHAIIAKHGGAS